MRASSGLAATILGLSLVLSLSACTSTPNSDQRRQSAMEPTESPSPAAAPISDPRDTREAVGKGFRLAANSAFQQLNLTSQNGQPLLVLRRASREPTLPLQVAVLREPNPAQGVVEESYALEVSLRTLSKATALSRSNVVWPDAEHTVLVQWTENVPTRGGKVVSTRYWQLNAQVNSKLTLIVIGFAPAAEFDDSSVGDIVRTFRIGG